MIRAQILDGESAQLSHFNPCGPRKTLIAELTVTIGISETML